MLLSRPDRLVSSTGSMCAKVIIAATVAAELQFACAQPGLTWRQLRLLLSWALLMGLTCRSAALGCTANLQGLKGCQVGHSCDLANLRSRFSQQVRTYTCVRH